MEPETRLDKAPESLDGDEAAVGEQTLDRTPWTTGKWELWAFYLYYVVRLCASHGI
jgi:hypothetical protein